MIPSYTIQQITEASRVEEIVGEFVQLKRRGSNFIALCPFHNEKTPSFHVSPAKGIYKCFGCGKAGNSINFLMEHEHYTYPEALRYLAKKYNIEIEETQPTPEEAQQADERESIYNILSFAQKYFTDNLLKSEKGKAIGLAYFIERGFSDETINKFQLGYCTDVWDEFTSHAKSNGYKIDYLVKAGLSAIRENYNYDVYRGRVLFPIHNLSGRVIGFGGRILSSDKTKPKYINSPESDIYHKSDVLYGIYFAKTAIIKNDNCYLVEGYTDVISLHQSGIENVVASSGTSLTTNQIKLIKRYTQNVTILYDGDAAGIKASFRGIDMILQEGLNVRVVLFPDGEDPDSYARLHRPAEVTEFINNASTDFIVFKTNLLLKETGDDPIKKSLLIKDMLKSISLIPDIIIRTEYLKECSKLMSISEQTLINELNKILKKNLIHDARSEDNFSKVSNFGKVSEDEQILEGTEYISDKQIPIEEDIFEAQEREIIRLLMSYGKKQITFRIASEEASNADKTNEHPVEEIFNVSDYIIDNIKDDKGIDNETIKFNNKIYQQIFDEYVELTSQNKTPEETYFVNHQDENIHNAAITLVTSQYSLSKNWKEMKNIDVLTEEDVLEVKVKNAVLTLKLKRLNKQIEMLQNRMKETNDEKMIANYMNLQKEFHDIKNNIAKELSRPLIK